LVKKFHFTEWYLLENAVSPTFETYFSTPRYCQTLLCIHLVLFLSSFSTPYKPSNFSDRIGVCMYFVKYLCSVQNSILSHNHGHFLSPLSNLLLIFWRVVSSVTYSECNNACLHTQQCMKKLGLGLKYIPRDCVRYVNCILQITIVMEWFPPTPNHL